MASNLLLHERELTHTCSLTDTFICVMCYNVLLLELYIPQVFWLIELQKQVCTALRFSEM